jgi:antitoxin component YwqK of YwqJK toxin-antitoxin module
MGAKILNIGSACDKLYTLSAHFTTLIFFLAVAISSSAQVEKVIGENGGEFRTVFERLVSDTTIKHGEYTVYFKQIKVIEGRYDFNHMTGTWRFYYPLSGELKSQGSYSNGVQVGVWNFYYPNGSLKAEKDFDKTKTTEWLSFYKNQNLRSRLIFRNDLLLYAFALSTRGDTLIVKDFAYHKEINTNIKTFYPSGLKSATYRYNLPSNSAHIYLHTSNGHPLFSKLLLDDGLNCNLDFKLNGSFRTFHKRGFLREHYIFDNGRLTQVLDMTTKFGTQLDKGGFNEGNGELLQYNANKELIRKLTYRDGVLNGSFQEFESATKKTHSVLTGEYKNGKPFGTWKKLDAFFKPEYELIFQNDSIVLFKEWYKSGSVEVSGQYQNRRRQGEWVGFDIYGDTLSTSNFNLGLKDGEFRDYLLSEMLRSGEYRRGARTGPWRSYNMSGMPTFEERYTSISTMEFSLSLDLEIPTVISIPERSGRFSRSSPQIICSALDYFYFDGQRFEVYIAIDREISGDSNFRISFDDNGFVKTIAHLASNKEVFLYYALDHLLNMPILEPSAIDGLPIGDSCNISFFFVPI